MQKQINIKVTAEVYEQLKYIADCWHTTIPRVVAYFICNKIDEVTKDEQKRQIEIKKKEGK